ncbi:hypothetical protein ACFQ0B_41800 [Nonomuraea thailandensis]
MIASLPASRVRAIVSWHAIASDSSAVLRPATPGRPRIRRSVAGGHGFV